MITKMNPVPPKNFSDLLGRPQLKITGLRIRNLRPIVHLSLPEDGISWEGEFPALCVIAGNNGSGKTTLLDFLYWVFQTLATTNKNFNVDGLFNQFPERWFGVDAEIDLSITLPQQAPTDIRIMVKELPDGHLFVEPDTELLIIYPRGVKSFVALTKGPVAEVAAHGRIAKDLYQLIIAGKVPSGVVYIPSGTRAVTVGDRDDKRAGPMEELTAFAYRWYRPERWKNSLESLLYSARWEDLNAIQNGHPEEATRSAMFTAAFERYFGKTKTLKWSNRGELFVEIASSKEQHGLDQLSAGEQQMLVLVGDLMYRWQPGSIILIDEPELHFHSAWQGYFWEFLREMLRERGGQVLLASQSADLFSAAELGERLILGM